MYRYVPTNVKEFLNETYYDGIEVFNELQTNIQDDLLEKTKENVNDFQELYNDIVNKLDEIRQLELEVRYTGPLSEQELYERNAGLEETKTNLRNLAENVKEEMVREEKTEEGMRKAIQSFITVILFLAGNQI